jgi:hypothetical protein
VEGLRGSSLVVKPVATLGWAGGLHLVWEGKEEDRLVRAVETSLGGADTPNKTPTGALFSAPSALPNKCV